MTDHRTFPPAGDGPRFVPARATLALDVAGLCGDDVDRQLGVWSSPTGAWKPGTAVDRWEDGTLEPTAEQVVALAALTKMPVGWFFHPIEVGTWGPVYMCDRSRRKHGLTIATSTVDARGVLHEEYH